MTRGAFDRKTGAITFDDLEVVVHPDLHEPDVVGHPRFEEWQGQQVARVLLLGFEFRVALAFRHRGKRRIDHAALWRTGPFDPNADRAFHDEFLAERLGWGPGKTLRGEAGTYGAVGYRFPWGRVESEMLPQDMNTHIWVAYH